MVEDHILSTTQGLVNRAYMDELWETSVNKIVAVLRTNCVSILYILYIICEQVCLKGKNGDKLNILVILLYNCAII